MRFIGAKKTGLTRTRAKQPDKRRQVESNIDELAPKKIRMKTEKPDERLFLTSTPKSANIKTETISPAKEKGGRRIRKPNASNQTVDSSKARKPNAPTQTMDEEEEGNFDALDLDEDTEFVQSLKDQLKNLPRKERGTVTPIKVNPYVGTPVRSPESPGFITRPPQPQRIRVNSSGSEHEVPFGGEMMRDSIETDFQQAIFRGELSGVKTGNGKSATVIKQGADIKQEEAQFEQIAEFEGDSAGGQVAIQNKGTRDKVVEMVAECEEDILSQIFKAHLEQSTQAFSAKYPGEQLDDNFQLEDNEISSIPVSRENSMVEGGSEEIDRQPDEDYEDEEEEEEEVDPNDDNGHELMLVNAAERMLNATSKVAKGGALVKDKHSAKQSIVDAVKQRIDRLRRAKSVIQMSPLSILEIEDDNEMQPDVIREMEREIEEEVLMPEAQLFVGWFCRTRSRVIIEDGRHRLSALRNVLNKINNRTPDKGMHYDFNLFKVRVQLLQGDKLTARIRKMTMEYCTNPSVFEKVMRVNFIMRGLQMMQNMTMQVRWILINEEIRGGGVPMYQVQAACLTSSELDVIKHGPRSLIDHSEFLRLYLRAREVNPKSAFKILHKLDGETDIMTHEEECRKLTALLNDITEMLVYKGYEEEDAQCIQERLYKCTNAYSAMKRLVTSKNGLSKINSELEEFILDLEHCAPPVTFIRPKITAITRVTQSTENTLFIFDYTEFKDQVIRHLIDLVYKQGRPLNILVINGTDSDVKSKLAVAQNERRQRREDARGRPRREGGSQPSDSNESFIISPHGQPDARLASQSGTNIGVINVTVGCAPFTEGTGIGAITRTTVTACLMRAVDREFLDTESLGRFLNRMHIAGAVTRSSLRLLSFNQTKADQCSRPNALFLHCSTLGAVAVAAYCSCYRITTLVTFAEDLKNQLIKKQLEMDDDWKDWKTYKSLFTQDGILRVAPGLIKRRNRVGMLKQAKRSGLIKKP